MNGFLNQQYYVLKTTDIDKFALLLAGGRFAFNVDITFLESKAYLWATCHVPNQIHFLVSKYSALQSEVLPFRSSITHIRRLVACPQFSSPLHTQETPFSLPSAFATDLYVSARLQCCLSSHGWVTEETPRLPPCPFVFYL